MNQSEAHHEARALRLVDHISKSLAVVAGLALIGLILTILLNVVTRKILGQPLSGTLDLSAYLWMPILTALAMGYALNKREHVRVSLITDNTSPLTRRLVEVFSLLVTAVLAAALAFFTLSNAWTQYGYGEVASGTDWLPIWPMRFLVGLGIAALALQALAEMVRTMHPDYITVETEQVV